MSKKQIFLKGAWITISRLFGGLIAGLFLGMVVFHLIPGSSVDQPTPVHASIAAIPTLIGFLGGGAAWGLSIGSLAGLTDKKRAAFAGLYGFSPITFILAVGLGMFEPMIIAAIGPEIPIHRAFTFIFVISAFLIAGISSWAIYRTFVDGKEAAIKSLTVGLTAALTFLVVNLTMEGAGWVVGAPGAAQRATMLVVLFTSNLVSAFTAGGVFGLQLLQKNGTSRNQAAASTI